MRRYLDDRYSYKLAPGFRKTVRTFVRPNTAEFRDSLFDLEFLESEQFYSVTDYDVDISLEVEDGVLLNYIMRLDHNQDHYERSVYTLVDLTGQIGGLYEIFQLVGRLCIGFISSKILILTMMSKMYHVQTPHNNENKDHWNIIGKNKTKTTICKRIEPKFAKSKFSNLSKRPELDESKSEINSNLSINKPASEVVKIDEFRRRPSAILNQFYEYNANKDSSNNNNDNQDSNDLIEQLKSNLENRRRYNFNCKTFMASLLPISSKV